MNLKETYFVLEDLNGKYYANDCIPNIGTKCNELCYARLFTSVIEADKWLTTCHGKIPSRIFRINFEIVDEKE